MDSTICGLNKVICYALSEEDNGKEVKISNGINDWTATVSDQVAAFLIPSIPVPARKVYTVTFGDFTRDIQMGYGDIIEVTLAEGYENLVGVDALDLEDIMTQGDISYKAAGAQAVKDVESDLRAEYNGDEIEFKFGVDEQGRYGYIKAGADSVTPFRTGQETLCYYLGTGRTFNIERACEDIKNTYGIDLNHNDLNLDNFVAQPKDGGWTSKWVHTHSGDDTFGEEMRAYMEPIAMSYSNGVLNISGATYYAEYLRIGKVDDKWYYSGTNTCTMKAYLIVKMN